MSWAGSTALSSSIGSANHIWPGLIPSACLDPTRLSAFDEFMDSPLAFAENQAMSSSDMQLVNSASEPPSQQYEEEQALSKFDYGPMADLCVCDAPAKGCHG
jgi:hypothetical protein